MSRKRILVVIGLVGVVILVVLALRPSPVSVDVVSVERGPLEVTLDEEGETRVRDRYLVTAPVPGRISRVVLEPGDPVVKGETVLATVAPLEPILLDRRDRATAEARVEAASATLDQARARHEEVLVGLVFARHELERVRALAEEGIESRRSLEAAETEVRRLEQGVRSAEKAVEAARAELAAARALLVTATDPGGDDGERPAAADSRSPVDEGEVVVLRSPVDGVVLERFRESAGVVFAGEPIVTVGDPSDLEIVADYLTTDAVRIEPGDRAVIEAWGGDVPLEGRVRLVEPFGFTKISALGVEEQRVDVILDFVDSPAARGALGHGYRVRVATVVWEDDDVLVAPTSSLFRQEGAWEVFVVEKGRAVRRRIEVGHRSDLRAEILDGLEAGERLVAYPSEAVEEGVRVEAR